MAKNGSGTAKARRERAAMKAAAAILEKAKLSPYDLYAYAIAADAKDLRDGVLVEAKSDESLIGYSIDDAMGEMLAEDLEDSREVLCDLYGRADEMLGRHFRGDGSPL